MGMDELQVRTWRQQWQAFNGHQLIRAVEGREGVHDFNFYHYPSIAYEANLNGVIARSEGRDALRRLEIVVSNFKKLQEDVEHE